MAHPALWALSVSLSLLVIGLGGHRVEWAFRDVPDVQGRLSAWSHAGQVMALTSVAGLTVSLSRRKPRGWIPWASIWAGLLLYCVPLFLFAVTGRGEGMPLVLPGICVLALGWGMLALGLRRIPEKEGAADAATLTGPAGDASMVTRSKGHRP